jgi:hypothetical protein
VIIHDPEWDYEENDTRGWLSLLKAVRELKELDFVDVDLILERNNIQYEPPQD